MKILLIKLTILILLLIPLSAYSEGLNITGAKITYHKDGTTLTESSEAPENPTYLDLWRDIDTNVLWRWNNGEWVCARTTQTIKDYIATFKVEWAQITDPHAKEAMKMLGRALLKLYNEDLQ